MLAESDEGLFEKPFGYGDVLAFFMQITNRVPTPWFTSNSKTSTGCLQI